MAVKIFKRLRELLDVDTTGVGDGDALVYDAGTEKWVPVAGGGGGGAPTDVNYLVGTADSGLSNEIVVGTSPGGELGGTWATPTVDATHSGSSHASVQAAAEATAASALSAHASDTTGIHGISDTSALLDTGDIGSSVAAQSHTHAGEDITSGTVADARIASTIARDSEVTSAINALSSVYQAKDTTLDTYAGIDPSSNVQSVLGAADYAAIRTLLGLVIGTNVQAYDADLTTYAGISPSSNVQSLLGAADYAAIRSLLGLVIGTNVQAYDADLTTYAGISPSSNVQSLLGAADYAAMRSLLGLVIGTNVQAYDAELAALAGLTSAADKLPYFTGSGTAAVTTLSSFIRGLLDDSDAATARSTLGITAGPYSSVKLYKSAGQTLNDASWTPITWDSESWDTDSYHSTSSQTDRIAIPANGRYRVIVMLNWTSNTSNQRIASVNKNGYPGSGGTELMRSTVQAAGNFEPTNVIDVTVDLTTSDYLLVAGYQNRGGTLDLKGGSDGVVSFVQVDRVYT